MNETWTSVARSGSVGGESENTGKVAEKGVGIEMRPVTAGLRGCFSRLSFVKRIER